MKLSIIIPYYNTAQYTDKLLNCLNSQITQDVEVLLIDDGSTIEYKTKYDWVKVFRKDNGGVSSARNLGLSKAKGTYVAFIDSDDLVSDNYIESILEKIDNEKFDYCYMSWKTLPESSFNYEVKLKDINSEFPPFNLCVWNRIYKRALIKDICFNENKKVAEDAEFIRKASQRCKKKSVITDFMYYYRAGRNDGLSMKFESGKIDSQRIVYYFNHITKDKKYLIDEIKRTNEYAEVIVMTDQNDIPELNQYALVVTPRNIKGTELRGMPTTLFQKIEVPQKTQVVIWTQITYEIGGIETFIYNFCANMHDKYDIVVLYNNMNIKQIERLKKFVRVQWNDPKHEIICDTLIVNRITDDIPKNIKYNKTVQMIHACNIFNRLVPQGRDIYVSVSDEVRKSYKLDTEVIHNVTYYPPRKKVLKLISATRLSSEKGGDRIKKLASMFKKANIPFIWFIFSAEPFTSDIDELIYMKATLNIQDYIRDCDYLVQLSDSEGFCYSVIEALEMGIPVITTPLPVLKELGVRDGIDGYFVPFDLNEIDLNKIYNEIPIVNYKYDNQECINKWIAILGKPNPVGDYVYHEEDNLIKVQITNDYYDTYFQRNMSVRDIVYMPIDRAIYISNSGYCKILD